MRATYHTKYLEPASKFHPIRYAWGDFRVRTPNCKFWYVKFRTVELLTTVRTIFWLNLVAQRRALRRCSFPIAPMHRMTCHNLPWQCKSISVTICNLNNLKRRWNYHRFEFSRTTCGWCRRNVYSAHSPRSYGSVHTPCAVWLTVIIVHSGVDHYITS